MLNSDYPYFEVKTTNQLFIENGKVYTREWYVEKKGSQQCMKVTVADPKTSADYRKHLARTPCLWTPEDETLPVPHGSIGGKQELAMTDGAIRLREYRAKKKKRGW